MSLFDFIITALQKKKMLPKVIKKYVQVHIATWHRHSQTQCLDVCPGSGPNHVEYSVSSPTLNFSTCGLIPVYENPSAIIRNL